jgi:hypothetical protein
VAARRDRRGVRSQVQAVKAGGKTATGIRVGVGKYGDGKGTRYRYNYQIRIWIRTMPRCTRGHRMKTDILVGYVLCGCDSGIDDDG